MAGDPTLNDQDRTVTFRTDLQPETDSEGVLTDEAAAKILREKISQVSGARSRGSNIVGDVVGALWGDGPQPAPTLGHFREEVENPNGGMHSVNPNRTLADKLAQIIPDSMKKASILQNGDVRALLQQIMIAPGNTERGEKFTINGVEFTANERAAAGVILVEMTNQIKTDFAKLVRENTEDPAVAEEAIRNFEANALYDFRDGVMKSDLPIRKSSFGTGTFGRDAEGNIVAIGGGSSASTEAATDYSDITSGEGQGNTYQYFNSTEVTDLFATTYDQNQTVQTIYQSEAQLREAQMADEGSTLGGKPVSVQYDAADTTDRIYGLSPDKNGNGGRHTTAKVPDKLTLTQMANKPREMTREQVAALTKRMEAAGIFEMIGDSPMIPGDWTDSAFKKGYERLMGMAVEQRIPMTEILNNRTSAYQKALEDSLATRLTDPARIRMNVDQTARSMLGRTLSPEEHEEFTKFVHDLERRNAKVEAGLDAEPGSIDDLDEGIIADIDARLSDKIQSENLTEFSGERVQDQYDTFSSFLAGPG
jgi:hypothetical protein